MVALWPKNKNYFPGHVVQIDHMNPQQPRYFVHFDDGDKIWSTINEIRRIPSSRIQGMYYIVLTIIRSFGEISGFICVVKSYVLHVH